MDGSAWQYMVLGFGTNDEARMGHMLNQYGSVGWEAVSIAGIDKTIGLNGLVLILKRPMRVLPPPEDKTDGWKNDPLGRAPWRWWAGRWTESVTTGGADKPSVDWPCS